MWALAITLALVLLKHSGAAEETAEGGERDCKCVPYYQCQSNTKEDEGSLLSQHAVSKKQCPNYLDVCCNIPPAKELNAPTPQKVNRKTACGIRNPEGIGFRVTKDLENEAQFGEFPWMVAVLKVELIDQPAGSKGPIKTQYKYLCGGSLIHPRVVLTGAHCVTGMEDEHLKIRAGEWDTQSTSEVYEHQDRDVERVIIHEDFKDNNLFNDVALLFLSKRVEPEENIGFACLPKQGYFSVPGTHCFASGWGKNQFGKESKYQVILKKVKLPVVNNEECQELLRDTRLGQYFKLHDSFMCAGGEKDKDTCKGDGGSPLVCPLKNNPNQYIQSGIVAWGIGCGENGIPGIYASVAVFRNWIDSKMIDANYDTSYYTH